jgi:hypothetical protein
VQLLRIITVLAKKAAELEKNQVPHLFLNTRIVNVDWCLDYFAGCWLASLLLCDKDKKKKITSHIICGFMDLGTMLL